MELTTLYIFAIQAGMLGNLVAAGVAFSLVILPKIKHEYYSLDQALSEGFKMLALACIAAYLSWTGWGEFLNYAQSKLQ